MGRGPTRLIPPSTLTRVQTKYRTQPHPRHNIGYDTRSRDIRELTTPQSALDHGRYLPHHKRKQDARKDQDGDHQPPPLGPYLTSYLIHLCE